MTPFIYNIEWRTNTEPPAQNNNKQSRVQEKLNSELFKRLPSGLKEELLKGKEVSNQDVALIRDDYRTWRDHEWTRKTALRACLEDKISEKELTYVFLVTMASEMASSLPGVKYIPSCCIPDPFLQEPIGLFCRKFNVPKELLGNPRSKEDAFLTVTLEDPLDSKKPYHHTAILGRELYPFKLTKPGTMIFVFPPHIYEQLLVHLHPENPERPQFVFGTQAVENFADDTYRVLSMTGGTTVPTPHIEAIEALSLPFYLHDCYHLYVGSLLGLDRLLWNAFGRQLEIVASKMKDPKKKEAFEFLTEFCLDKEFQGYTVIPEKNRAFLTPLLGMYELAGCRRINNQEDPFQPIGDAAFTKEIRREFLSQFKQFWMEQVPKLRRRPDLNRQELVKVIPELTVILERQREQFSKELKEFINTL